MRGCPIGVDIPMFIRLLRERNISQAYAKIKESNPLPAVCGRICSAKCEAACVLTEESGSIGIRSLERYVADHSSFKPPQKSYQKPSGKKIAIIGSGPSGMSAASRLAQSGFKVTIFEAMDKLGGVLRYGIPEFRMPKKVLDQQIDEILALGVKTETNFYLGKSSSVRELKDSGFDAVLLACGAGVPKFIDIGGVNLGGVYYGEEFLMRINRMKSSMFSKWKANFVVGDNVAVIGSGNTALDCARCVRRLGKNVTLIFRRSEDEMYVRSEEREFAKEEGVKVESLSKPVEILSDPSNFVGGLKCVRMDYAEVEGSEQWELAPVPGSEFIIDVDTVIIAVGHKPNSILAESENDLKMDDDLSISVDEDSYMTSLEGVFACGNVVTNAGPVVEAIASGKKAAEKIMNYFERGPDEDDATNKQP